MRISDWSSDVCSSDLQKLKAPARKTRSSGGMFDGLSDEALDLDMLRQGEADIRVDIAGIRALGFVVGPPAFAAKLPGGDRKSVVQGKSVSVRVDIGGRRTFK